MIISQVNEYCDYYSTNLIKFFYFKDKNTIGLDECLLSGFEDNLFNYIKSNFNLLFIETIVSFDYEYNDCNQNLINTNLYFIKNCFIKYIGNKDLLYDTIHHYFLYKFDIDPFDNHDFLKMINRINNSFSNRNDYAYTF